MLPSFLDGKLHHIGVAVRDIGEALQMYARLGYYCGKIVYDPLQNVNLAYCTGKGTPIELVSPVDESSPCNSFLEKIGAGTYHTCYACGSIEECLRRLKGAGVRYVVVSEAKPAELFEGKRVMFLLFPSIGLVELLEANSGE